MLLKIDKVHIYRKGKNNMNTTQIIANLIEKGFVVEDFYNSGIELVYEDSDLSTTTTVGEETLEISVRDREEKEVIMSLDVNIERLTEEQLETILKLVDSLTTR